MITHVISALHPKLLVISGTDWRKPDLVTADSWVYLVGRCCPWINARPWLCTWAVSLWPRPLCYYRLEKHHARSGWCQSKYVVASIKPFLYSLSLILAKWVLCPLSFMFQQITCITLGNSWQTISTVHMTMAQSCIMEGELLFKATELQHSHVTGTSIQALHVSPIQICLLWRWRTNNNTQTRSLHSHWPARWTQFTWSS